MKIAVCVKQVPDTETIIKIADEKNIDESGIKWIINPYDEYAIEEAIRIKEKISDTAFTVFSIGPDRVESSLRSCLALGADRAVHLTDPLFAGTENFLTATVLAAAIKKDGYDLLLFGKQAIDGDGAMTAGMVAHLLDLPFIAEINKLEFPDEKSARVSRLVEGSTEVWDAPLPAVFSCQKGLNEPRLPPLKAIMQAKKKTIEKMSAADLGMDAEKLKEMAEMRARTGLEFPPPRPQGKTLDDSDASITEVAGWLKESGII
ncbi:MAG: electron transfer flavoprotein subunit beta/FixA family protein [Nitrospinota bacterium]